MPPRSPCNLKKWDECSKPQCVPVRRGGSPHHCRSFPRKRSCKGKSERECKRPGCTPVRRDGRFHHCRTPSRKSPPPSKSPRKPHRKSESPRKPHRKSESPRNPPRKSESPHTSHLQSAKAKIWNAILRNEKDCSSFSLQQRNGTCYMASSTLLFARVALHDCKDESVRRFVRLTMANAWDDAQGPVTDATCPNIPTSIRRSYDDLNRTVFDSREITTVEPGKSVEIKSTPSFSTPFGRGGITFYFLASLFFASEISCSFTLSGILFDSRQEYLEYPSAAEGRTLDEYVDYAIRNRLPRTKYNILAFHCARTGYSAPRKTNKIERLLDSTVVSASSQGMRVEGVILSIGNETKGHAVTLYPCNKKGMKWICCNSWGDDCSDKGVPHFVNDVLEGMKIKRKGRFKAIGFVLRRV